MPLHSLSMHFLFQAKPLCIYSFLDFCFNILTIQNISKRQVYIQASLSKIQGLFKNPAVAIRECNTFREKTKLSKIS